MSSGSICIHVCNTLTFAWDNGENVNLTPLLWIHLTCEDLWCVCACVYVASVYVCVYCMSMLLCMDVNHLIPTALHVYVTVKSTYQPEANREWIVPRPSSESALVSSDSRKVTEWIFSLSSCDALSVNTPEHLPPSECWQRKSYVVSSSVRNTRTTGLL